MGSIRKEGRAGEHEERQLLPASASVATQQFATSFLHFSKEIGSLGFCVKVSRFVNVGLKVFNDCVHQMKHFRESDTSLCSSPAMCDTSLLSTGNKRKLIREKNELNANVKI